MAQRDVKLNEALERAAAAHRAGDLAAAERLYKEILRSRPGQVDALHYLGVVLAQGGRLPEAHRLIVQAAAARPQSADIRISLGNVERGLDRLEAALQSYAAALAVAPGAIGATMGRAVTLQSLGRLDEALAAYGAVPPSHPAFLQALNNRAAVLLQLGRLDEALAGFDAVVAKEPRHAQAWSNRGLVLQAMGRAEEALASYDRAIALAPGYAPAHDNRGGALREMGRLGEALASHERALALSPRDPEAENNRANVLSRLGRHEEALQAYDRALALAPGWPEALSNRGAALMALKRFAEALGSLDAALAARPDYAEALNNRGIVLCELGRAGDALASYDAALAARPGYAEALGNRATALKDLKRYEEAAADYARALAADAACDYALGGLLQARQQVCDWREFEPTLAGVVAAVRAGKRAIIPFPFLAVWDDAADHRRAAEIYIRHKFPPLPAAVAAPPPDAGGRLRLAYLSADLRAHPIGYLTAGVFERHDKARFETTALSFGPDDGSALRARLEKSFERFIDVRRKTDAEIAALLKDLRIDIAVDLQGFTQGARTGILARRPAPLQVSYLGYPGTLGAGYVDYIIADPTVIPESGQRHYVEKIAALPDCYQPNDRRRPIAERTPTRAEAGLPEAGVVFCCFNNSYKILPAVFDAWMRILGGVPGSVLWLMEDSPAVARNLGREAAARGIDPARLVFAPRIGLDDHLARHRLADLFLDTLPYNAHTTASDALWAGVPVLTVSGEAFAGRVAASLLGAAGMPELIAASRADYEARAIALGRDGEALAQLKARLGRRRESAPLFDAERFRRHLERAFEIMAERRRRGLPPESFAVAPMAS